MRSTTLLLLLTFVCPFVASAEETKTDRFAPVAELAGRCFTGTMPDGTRDTHCWEWTLDGKFLRDRHEVTGGKSVYRGETFYGWDEREGVLRFWYFNNIGGASDGTVVRDAKRWRFDENYRGTKADITMRSFLQTQDEDHYAVVSEHLQDDEWKLFFEVRFEALAPEAAAKALADWR